MEGTSASTLSSTLVNIFTRRDATHLAAIADGQEKTVQLPRSRHDTALTKSIISQEKARATKGTIKDTPESVLVDATGLAYTSRGTINLRWYVKDSAQSFSETFYVVDSCAPHDAMLRKDIQRTDRSTAAPHAYPFHMERTRVDRERERKMALKREKDVQLVKARAEQRVREQYEEKKRALAASRR